MTTINNSNLRQLIQNYFRNPGGLPEELRGLSLNDWDVSAVINMSNAFADISEFNEPIGRWDVSKVTEMNHMFYGCTNFNQNLSEWNLKVSKVKDMTAMFLGCTSFGQDNLDTGLSRWETDSVKFMTGMFKNCVNFNEDINNWDVSIVENMSEMFSGCTSFNKPLNEWDVSEVQDMTEMFSDCTMFDQPLNEWELNDDVITDNMFLGCNIEFQNKPRLVQQRVLESIAQIPLNTSTDVQINSSESGYDPIDNENKNIFDFLREDASNIIIYINPRNIILTSRNNILTAINNLSNTKYECGELNRMSTIIYTVPYFLLRGIGGTNELVPMGEIKTLLEDPQYSSVQALKIVPGRQILTTTSLLSLMPGATEQEEIQRYRSTSHCQEGQGGTFADIQIITLNLPTIGGGKTKRRYKRRYKKGYKSKKNNHKKVNSTKKRRHRKSIKNRKM